MGTWYADTLFSPFKSLMGHTCAKIFTDTHMTSVHPLVSKAHAGKALEDFTDDVGVPARLIFDGSGEQTGVNTDFQKNIR